MMNGLLIVPFIAPFNVPLLILDDLGRFEFQQFASSLP